MTAKLDAKKYGELLAAALPTVIESEEEKERIMAVILEFMDRGEELPPEEAALLHLLSKLVEDYEAENTYIEPAPPHVILQTLMEERGLRQRDLLDIFGHRGLASEVINGKRGISKRLARDLADFFNVSPELFLWEDYRERKIARKRRAKKAAPEAPPKTVQLFFSFVFEDQIGSQVIDLQAYKQTTQPRTQSVEAIGHDRTKKGTGNDAITSAA